MQLEHLSPYRDPCHHPASPTNPFYYSSLTTSSVQMQPEQAVCNFKKAIGVLTTAHGTVLTLDCPQAIVDTCRNGSKKFWDVPAYAIEGPNIPKADSRKQDAM